MPPVAGLTSILLTVELQVQDDLLLDLAAEFERLNLVAGDFIRPVKDVIVGFYGAEDLTEGALHLFGAELGPAAHTIPHVLDEFAVCFSVAVAAVQCWQVAMHELS